VDPVAPVAPVAPMAASFDQQGCALPVPQPVLVAGALPLLLA